MKKVSLKNTLFTIGLLLFLCCFLNKGELFLQLAPSFAAVTGQSSQSTTAPELIDKIIKAYGGLDALKDLETKAVKSEGKLESTSRLSGAANDFDCLVITKGKKLRVETVLLGQPMIQVYDGKNSWSKFGDWVQLGNETMTKRMSEELEHGLELLQYLKDPSYNARLGSTRTINGKTYQELIVTAKDGKDTVFCIDPYTGLVARSEYMGVDSEQGIAALQSFEYDDYRPLFGTLIPFKVTEYSGDKKSSVTTMSGAQLLADVSDSIFVMPAEGRVAQVADRPINVSFDYQAKQIVVRTRIDRKYDYKFLVDTGASMTVIDKSIAQELGPATKSSFSITAGGKAVPLSYTTIPTISIGDLVLDNIPALVTDLSAFQAILGEKPAGLIGANILKRFLVTIDYQDKKIVFADPLSVKPPENATMLKTVPLFGSTVLVVPGVLDDKNTVNFLVDTGASFNNLPQSIAKQFTGGSTLPVGRIFGLDGQKVEIGSVRLKSLKLNDQTLTGPVFTIPPETPSSAPPSGLFTASSMGILGNPVWSNFRLTIDYRNERLFLEPISERKAFEAVKVKLDDTYRQYLKDRSIEHAITGYDEIAKVAGEQNCKAGEALAHCYTADIYVDKFELTRDSSLLNLAAQEYGSALKLAQIAHDPVVEAEILGKWALVYLDAGRKQENLQNAQNLLTRSASRAPTCPAVHAVMGIAAYKAGLVDKAAQVLDQALMLDPSNWRVLWAKYAICKSLNKTDELNLVANQLRFYYPDVPEVQGLGKNGSAVQSSTTPSTGKTGTIKTGTPSLGKPAQTGGAKSAGKPGATPGTKPASGNRPSLKLQSLPAKE